MQTITINAARINWIRDEFAILNKRAAKLGLNGVELVIHREWSVERYPHDLALFPVTIHKAEVSFIGENPKLGGWRLIAVLEPFNGSNIVRTIPGETVPESFFNCKPACDHCGVNRLRTETFLLQHESGEIRQVGRTCLQDFLGGIDPAQILAMATSFTQAVEILSDGDDYYSCGTMPKTADSENVLTLTSILIRRLGWVAKKDASFEAQATAQIVSELMFPASREQENENTAFIREHNLDATEQDRETAKNVLAWIQTVKANGSEYLHNLKTILSQPEIREKDFGFACSAIVAYRKAMEKDAAFQQTNVNKRHVGVIGERPIFRDLKIERIHYAHGPYGSTAIVTFSDQDGNAIVSFYKGANNDWLVIGDTVTISGTIKKHEVFRGVPQTTIERIALWTKAGLESHDAKEAKKAAKEAKKAAKTI